MVQPLPIIVDTRERCPYGFEYYDATAERATSPTGDYSLKGFQDRLAIERKELDDLVACLMGANRERFERELQRLSHYELAAVVVEASLADIRAGRYRSEMRHEAVAQSVFAFQVRHRVPFLFCGDRAGGEYVTFSLLSKFDREIRERFKLLTRRPRQSAAPATQGTLEASVSGG